MTELKRYGEAEEKVDWQKIKEAERKLKPCPFCGSNPIINYVPPHTHEGIAIGMADHQGSHFIECSGCSCAMAFGNDLNEAVDGWNNRTNEEKKYPRKGEPDYDDSDDFADWEKG